MVWPVFVQLQPQVFSLESILDNEEERSQRRRSRHPSTHFNKHRLSWIKLVIRGPVIYQLLRACEIYTSEGRRKPQTSIMDLIKEPLGNISDLRKRPALFYRNFLQSSFAEFFASTEEMQSLSILASKTPT